MLMPLINRILTENQPWLTRFPDGRLTTPYSRAAHTTSVILPYSFAETTLTQFNFNRDGQTASYTRDGAIWHQVNFMRWGDLIRVLITRLSDSVSKQLPSGVNISNLVDRTVGDDLSKRSPHLQAQNTLWMKEKLDWFESLMLSPSESRHQLIQNGHLGTLQVSQYIKNDQEIRGILSTLFAASSAVTMRAFQFASIMLDSSEGFDRNTWMIDDRFVIGKPLAKQYNIQFAHTLFWFPRMVTSVLAALFFFQQPFICTLLQRMGKDKHLYASHVWPLFPLPPNTKSNSELSMVWKGSHISDYVRRLSEEIIETRLDPALIRQMAEGLIRDKIPSLFEAFLSRNSQYLQAGSYRFPESLQAYAGHHGLQAICNVTGISVETAAECLIVVDIWQCMHGIEPSNNIWKPMVINSHLFPATEHDELAYLEAQNLKQTHFLTSGHVISENILTGGLKLLCNSTLSESDVSIISALGFCVCLIYPFLRFP